MGKLTRRMMTAAGLGLMLSASVAFAQQPAQQPQTVRIRGTIEKVDGNMMTIKTREGSNLDVKLADNARVQGLAKASLGDIKQNSYIGVTAMPQPDGSQRAVAIHIFMEQQRGLGEGHRPWDQQPGSTMTNAAVETTVAGVNGQEITVKYKDGEKKVVVPEGTPVVTFVAGDKSELKPGAKIIIFGAVKKDDGTLEAARVNVGRNGITPPM
jgi:outer membrane lipoprotein SlyB